MSRITELGRQGKRKVSKTDMTLVPKPEIDLASVWGNQELTTSNNTWSGIPAHKHKVRRPWLAERSTHIRPHLFLIVSRD